MAGKILPHTGKSANNPGGPAKLAMSGLGGFVFWLAVAILFPYSVLVPYWPEAVGWAPVALYLLAFFNLLKAGYHASRAVRMKRPNPSAGRSGHNQPTTSARSQDGVRARKADREERNSRPASDDGRNRAMPQINRAPTVKRMR